MPTEHKTYEIVVQPRRITGKKSKKLRREHILPAIVYGYGVDPTPIAVDQKEMERVYLRAGSNSLVDLKVEDGSTARKVFIHNVQRSPTTHVLTHVDFLAVNLLVETTTTVPLVLVGEAPAVVRKEGMLLHALDHLLVKALPANIPSQIEVDISSLDEVDKAIHISDLPIPDNVTLLTSEEELVAKITALPQVVVEEVEEAAEEGAAEAGAAEDENES